MSSDSMRPWEKKRLDAIQREGPSPEVFEHWRSPRFGIHNPDNLTNAFWTFAIRHGGSGHGLNQDFDGPDSFDAGPCFSFQRYGQIELTLPDGRRVHIGGAHEDFYDPDFCIYNDVVVIDGDEISVYGYPETVFPPTDYATATLVGDDIWIVGNLGYREQRDDRPTQVLILNTQDWSIQKVPCKGIDPGWISGHQALLSRDEQQLLISGGECYCRLIGMSDQNLPNPDIHILNLSNRSWMCFDRQSNCSHWLLTTTNQTSLKRIRDQQVEAKLGHQHLQNIAPKWSSSFHFKSIVSFSDDQSLDVKVNVRGRDAIVTVLEGRNPLSTNLSHDCLMNDLRNLLESHFENEALQLQAIERIPRS